jgi:hypothetical protein
MMLVNLHFMLGTFTLPMDIATTPQGLLWMLPLVLAISISYKAMKLPELKLWNFMKETVGLFASIVVFMVLIGVGLLVFDWLILQRVFF